jgi:chemotaxis protein MotC
MKRLACLVPILCWGSVSFFPLFAVAAEPAPFELIRSLQALEDQIALGNAAAQATQPKMIAHIAERFAAFDPKTWHDRKNVRAAILYLFSGGRPAALQSMMDSADIDKDDEKLLKGAMAYAQGRDAEARGYMMDINPLSLPSNLGGHLALVQATLLANEDVGKALKLLDIARLLVPGTLVEEAALRREIFMIGQNGDLDKFTLLSRQYMHRFGKAVYADNFRQRFAAMVSEIGLSNDMTQVMRLEKILADLGPEEQTKLYLSIAETALVQGRTAVARYAADRAAKFSMNRNADLARSNLYLGASIIATDSYDKGLALLNSIDVTHLSKKDEELRQAALDIAKAIHRSVVDTVKTDLSREDAVENQNKDEAKTWPAMDQALKAIGDADALLSEPGQ